MGCGAQGEHLPTLNKCLKKCIIPHSYVCFAEPRTGGDKFIREGRVNRQTDQCRKRETTLPFPATLKKVYALRISSNSARRRREGGKKNVLRTRGPLPYRPPPKLHRVVKYDAGLEICMTLLNCLESGISFRGPGRLVSHWIGFTVPTRKSHYHPFP